MSGGEEWVSYGWSKGNREYHGHWPHLEEAVKKRNVVGPLLEGSLEEGESSFHGGSIFAIVLILLRRGVVWQG